MLVVNNLISWKQEEKIRCTERILWIGSYEDNAYVIDVNSNAIPFIRSVEDIKNEVIEGSAIIEANDGYIRIEEEENISEKDREKRDAAWEVIRDIIGLEPQIFFSRERKVLIEKVAAKYKVSEKTVLNYLKRYWKRGKTKNALLPDFYLCGGRGKEKAVNSTKRGRPRKNVEYVGTGVNIDEEIKKIFRVSINKFYNTSTQNSLMLTYQLMLKEYFSENYKIENGVKIPIIKPACQVPTFTQFKYWFEKERDIKKEIIGRMSSKKYQQKHRPILGNSTIEAMGPGSIYQIDATVGDVYLVSRFNRNWIIGRPVIYAVIDVFSRMVVGIYIGLEGPSMIGAMAALANTACKKVEFCKEYGININESDWPVHHLPETILADRGELEGKGIENLINGLQVKVSNTPPYRADWKGIVEQHFRVTNLRVKPFVPGAVDFEHRERGDKDYRLNAKLDIYQFTQIIIKCVLYHNNHHYLKNYNKDEMMIADDIKCIPINLWNWGISNRAGKLRYIHEDIVKLHLMPSDSALVTAKGIKFKNLYYGSKSSLKEKWFEKARNRGSWKINICYDPRNLNYIYIKNFYGEEFEKCYLLEYQNSHRDKSLEEIEYLIAKDKIDAENTSHIELQSKIDLISEIESIVKEAEKSSDEEIENTYSDRKRIKGIKGNRKIEKMINRENEAFELGVDKTEVIVSTEENKELEQKEEINDIDLLRKKLREGMKKRYE